MTMHAITEEQAPIPQSFELPIDALRQIANVALFASTDPADTVLRAVRVALDEHTGSLLAMATDRYILAWERIELDGPIADRPEPFAVLLELAGVQAAVKLLPRKPKALQTVTVALGETHVTFATADAQVRVPVVNGEWVPRWRSLIPVGPTDLDGEENLVFGLNTSFLAKLAKVRTETKNAPARIKVTTRRKPLTVDVGDTFSSLWMPVNLAS